MATRSSQEIDFKMSASTGHAGILDGNTETRTGTRAGRGPASAWLSIFSYFVREVLCSPARILRVLVRISSNLSAQLSVLPMVKIRPIARLVSAHPKFLFKYLPPAYLMRGLAAPTRTACFVHHYRRLHLALPDDLLDRILQGDLAIFSLSEADHRFEITLGRSLHVSNSRQVDNEGELSLRLLVDGTRVYVLSFTIVPGWVVESPAAEIFLVTRIQGELGVFPQISLASKAMHGMPPEMLLMAALQGLGEAFQIREMAGIGATRHLSYWAEEDAIFKRAYDEFFTRIGAVQNPAGFYAAFFPLPEKSLSLVKRGQKTRARARRAFKRKLAVEVFEFFRLLGATAAESFSWPSETEEAEEIPDPQSANPHGADQETAVESTSLART
jgi:uncharacterized protein VirK/YbjX